MSLFSELKRRNVFRVGVAYLIVAWLLMQVTDLAVPALRLPDWVTTFVVFILILGLPVAILLAWAFEVTPDGIRKTEDVPLERSIRKMTGKRLNYTVIALLTIAVTFLLVDRTRERQASIVEEGLDFNTSPSLAVLPFDNLSGDPEQGHFADGLTEELLNVLARIDGLRLVSRTSSFTFKDRNLPIPEIASQLGVQHILEGSIRRSGERIRITAQLIDADDDTHLWSRTYDRDLSVESIFEIQEEVAAGVAQVLHATLRRTDQSALSLDPPQSIEAFDHYLAGMEHVRQLELGQVNADDVSEFENAVTSFEASIALDPDWAPAHAGLGRVHHFWLHRGREQQLRLAREHIEEAIRLDSSYGPAWGSLGYIETQSGNFDEALRAYNRARDLGAGNNWGRAILFRHLGQYDRSVEEYRLARQWNPLSLAVRGQLIGALYCAGRNDPLLEAVSDFVDEQPNRGRARGMLAYARVKAGQERARGMLAYARVKAGQVEQGLAIADDVAAAEGSDLPVLDVLALAGERARVLRTLEDDQATDFWETRAAAAAVLGETDTAVDILESVEDILRSPAADVRCSPEIRQLAGNPRYEALLQRLDLPE